MPAARSVSASRRTSRPAAARIAAARWSAGQRRGTDASEEIGFRHTTRSRPSPARRSRFDTDQIPPSTYCRPAMETGW